MSAQNVCLNAAPLVQFSAKCRTNFRRDLTLHSAKLEFKRIFRESFRLTASRVARDKPWSTLCKKSHGIPSSPRAAAVAKFRLLTGHDCLCAHLLRFNLVTSPICVLCDTGQDMTAAHLDECSALNDLNCIVKRLGGRLVACCSSTPRSRGSILGLGKVDSTFHPMSGSINKYQAFLGSKPRGFRFEHLFGTSAYAPQGPKVTYTEMGTVDLGPYGLLRH
ncbi:uncharacterized protein TNCV_2881061 [Trichonephila clavipes]|nr:uncharacterized protein TNCV_2881061 [Trichonephila clavipes]